MASIRRRWSPALVGDPQIDRVGGRVLVARGFDLGNVIRLATADGALFVDAASAVSAAARARAALDEIEPLATSHLVYTHCHNDHTSGAEALADHDGVEIIAQAALPGLIERDHGCLGNWTVRHRSSQRGRPDDHPFLDRGYREPTVLFEEEHELEVGGESVRLEHTEGESRDHLLAWLPERGVLCSGDLIYPAFPNLSTPAVGPRPIRGWVRSLERMVALEAEHLVPSHGPPVSGRAEVRALLEVYRDAIEHVWTESVALIDAGVDVSTAARTVRLPEPLARHPWLRPIYGTVNWGVRAVYDSLTGWYDLRPASLDPLPRGRVEGEVVGLVGAEPMAERACSLLAGGEAQLALELADLVLAADPEHLGAHQVHHDACVELRGSATSLNEKGFYHSGVVRSRQAVERLGGEVAARGSERGQGGG